MSTLHQKLEALHDDAVTLSGLCDLAVNACCEKPDWDLSPLLMVMAKIADRVAADSDWFNLRKGGEE